VLVEGLEPSNHAVAEPTETFAFGATQDPNEVGREFEGRCLELQTLPWSVCKHETEVDVD